MSVTGTTTTRRMTNAQDPWPVLSGQAAIPATLEAVLLSVPARVRPR
jgi:hypothetical protein